MSLFTKKTKYKAGQIIFDQGDNADCAYIIDKGQVEIFVESQGIETPLSLFAEGEIFGEMAIIDGRRRSATARAFTDCVLTVVFQNQVQERVEKADSIVRLLLMILLKRIRSNNESISQNNFGLDMFQSYNKPSTPADPKVVMEKIKFESELLEALEKNHFVLFYQPIVDLKSGAVLGAEALIRWQSQSRGLVSPDIFMGIAEDTSMIVPIGRWVINQASKDLKAFQKIYGKKFYIGVNISGRQFQDPNFFNDLESAVKEQKINRKDLRLEITEGVLLNGAFAINCIKKLHELGFQVTLDDFGTGYSSLSYLSELQFNFIKIDRSFVKKMLVDEKSMILCRSIANIAKDLGLSVIAEGIEEKNQAKALKDMHCQYGQGYLYGKPQPIEAFLAPEIKRKAS
jgi:EAL domain-containing protein (putative c-di-GMP-specific phosphodiesterase class I)/CRP-like cAMP-binding protein